MALVISDSSTIMHLAQIGQLSLLKDLYGVVTVPPAVRREIVTEGKGRSVAGEMIDARQSGWVKIDEITDTSHLPLLLRELDQGEAQVIALAIERAADLVLLDETEARQVAELYGISKTGVIGILIRAKTEGRIELLRPLLDLLRDRGGFWIGNNLYSRALRVVGET